MLRGCKRNRCVQELIHLGPPVSHTLFLSPLALPLHPVLASVIATIAVNKWRMTKGLGYTMFALYAIFVAQDLARTYGLF